MKKSTNEKKDNKIEDVILNFIEDIEIVIRKNGKKFGNILIDKTTKKINQIISENKLLLRNKLEEKQNKNKKGTDDNENL